MPPLLAEVRGQQTEIAEEKGCSENVKQGQDIKSEVENVQTQASADIVCDEPRDDVPRSRSSFGSGSNLEVVKALTSRSCCESRSPMAAHVWICELCQERQHPLAPVHKLIVDEQTMEDVDICGNCCDCEVFGPPCNPLQPEPKPGTGASFHCRRRF